MPSERGSIGRQPPLSCTNILGAPLPTAAPHAQSVVRAKTQPRRPSHGPPAAAAACRSCRTWRRSARPRRWSRSTRWSARGDYPPTPRRSSAPSRSACGRGPGNLSSFVWFLISQPLYSDISTQRYHWVKLPRQVRSIQPPGLQISWIYEI